MMRLLSLQKRTMFALSQINEGVFILVKHCESDFFIIYFYKSIIIGLVAGYRVFTSSVIKTI